MYKLLLAEHSDAAIREVMEALDDRWEVRICSDGDLVMEVLLDFEPDVLIIDLSLPGKNAVSIIADCFPNLPSLIIALGSPVNPFVRQNLSRWGVDYVFETLSGKGMFKQLLRSPETFTKIAAKRTAEHLRVLGVRAGLVGYVYLMLAVPFISEDTTRQLHNELYDYISKRLNIDVAGIEHAIRNAISSAWKTRTYDVWCRYFHVNEAGDFNCPNVKDFIGILAQKIR